MLRIADGGDGETVAVRLEGEAQILELGGESNEDEDAVATSSFEAMREDGAEAVGQQRSLYHDMYLQHQQQKHQQQQQEYLQQQEQQQQGHNFYNVWTWSWKECPKKQTIVHGTWYSA